MTDIDLRFMNASPRMKSLETLLPLQWARYHPKQAFKKLPGNSFFTAIVSSDKEAETVITMGLAYSQAVEVTFASGDTVLITRKNWKNNILDFIPTAALAF